MIVGNTQSIASKQNVLLFAFFPHMGVNNILFE